MSTNAPPALIKKAAATLFAPHPDGSIQYPIPIRIAATGKHATGSINDLPSLCKYFIIIKFPLFFYLFIIVRLTK